jgi:hypothetical protein
MTRRTPAVRRIVVCGKGVSVRRSALGDQPIMGFDHR